MLRMKSIITKKNLLKFLHILISAKLQSKRMEIQNAVKVSTSDHIHLEKEENNLRNLDYQQQFYDDHHANKGMDNESEFLFDKETIKFIEGLRNKFGFEGEIDHYEFIQKIQNELNKGVKNDKQRLALEELKR